jgi:hypothetical protein
VKKLIVVAGLLVAGTLYAQSVETLGMGTPTTTCSYSGSCTASVIRGDGKPNGTIEIHASSGILHRYAIDGTKLWDSTDYQAASGVFTHGGVQGTLTYTLASQKYSCGGSGRYVYTCTYRWVAGGTLAE